MKRRDLLRAILASPFAAACGAASGPCPTGATPAPSATPSATPAQAIAVRRAAPAGGPKKKVLCVGAHPDDPETACGGTLARYAEAGHEVHVLYVTKGELGIEGKKPDEAGAIRAAEAEEACKILGATPHFFGHPSGQLVDSPETLGAFIRAVDAIGPDVMFGHWPLDPDFDHEVSAAMTVHAYLAKPRAHPLYLFEVESGTQTLGFVPQAYVEIGPVLRKKLDAIRAHKSQDAERRLYERHHEPMERFRAREIGGTAAEAFFVLAPDAKMHALPGL